LDGHDRWLLLSSVLGTKNVEYVYGIPVPNNYKPHKIYGRFRGHSQASTHILACKRNAEGVKNEPEDPISLAEIEENEAIKIDPTEAEIENKRLEEETSLNYIENTLKPKFDWLQLSEGKLFCKVRNMKIISQNFYFTLHAISSNSKLLGKLG